jgi:hypothetical protein
VAHFDVLVLDAGMTTIDTTSSGQQTNAVPAGLQFRNRVLIVTASFPPANFSGSKRPFRFAKYLPGNGWECDVVTQPAGGMFPSSMNVHVAVAPSASALTKAGSRAAQLVQRWLLPYNDDLPWLPYAIETAGDVILRKRPAAVLSTSPPISTHLTASWLKMRYGLKWIADFRDPLYGNPFRQRKMAWIYDSAMERHICGTADWIIANTDSAAEMLRRRYPAWAHKISVIWNGYDPDESVSALPLGKRSHKLLIHTGGVYGPRHPGMLLDSISRLTARGFINAHELKVRLVGALNVGDPWVGGTHFHHLANLGMLEYTASIIPEEDARREMGAADYLLLLNFSAADSVMQVPAKLFDYLLIGRPILALTVPGSPVDRILAQAGIPYCSIYPNDTAEQVDHKVLSFLSLPTAAVPVSDWFRNRFSGALQTAELAAILDNVTSSRCPT